MKSSAGKVLHTILIALYALLAFYVANANEVEIGAVSRLLALVIGLAAGALTFAFLIRCDLAWAGLAASIALILFTTYGHLYEVLKRIGLPRETFVRHRYLLPLLLAVTVWALYRLNKQQDLSTWTKAFNVFALVAISLPLVQLVAFRVETARNRGSHQAEETQCILKGHDARSNRDIYLIIMDAYERDDILWEMHRYDNSPFLDALETRGFFVARGSLSNYNHTELSLASLLNMNYIQNYPERYSVDSNNRMGIVDLIENNGVRRELQCIGYEVVAFETGHFWTEWDDADHYLSMSSGPQHNLKFSGGITRFEGEFLNTTLMRAYFDGLTQIVGIGVSEDLDPIVEYRQRILFTFAQLTQVPSLSSPKFVFVHILSPHPPMVFGPAGEPVRKADFNATVSAETREQELLDAYVDQVTYLNTRLLEAVDTILTKSESAPIIIIMGDHGWADRNPEDKLSILNAYYLPGEGQEVPYPTITPVNSFRLIFERYYGTDIGLLEDESYYSVDEELFGFVKVPNTWKGD